MGKDHVAVPVTKNTLITLTEAPFEETTSMTHKRSAHPFVYTAKQRDERQQVSQVNKCAS